MVTTPDSVDYSTNEQAQPYHVQESCRSNGSWATKRRSGELKRKRKMSTKVLMVMESNVYLLVPVCIYLYDGITSLLFDY